MKLYRLGNPHPFRTRLGWIETWWLLRSGQVINLNTVLVDDTPAIDWLKQHPGPVGEYKPAGAGPTYCFKQKGFTGNARRFWHRLHLAEVKFNDFKRKHCL